MSHTEHETAGRSLTAHCLVITCSDTRTAETDTSGAFIRSALEQAGHFVVGPVIVPDEPEHIRAAITGHAVDFILITGGTGLAPRDTTWDTLHGLYESTIPGFGELFRMLSYDEIGPAAMLSRASAGRLGRTVIFSMPGSRAAVRLAMERIIIPQMGHISGLLEP
ncbi:MAG: MogA/MoaB family molybdenum cofactor biosynthesis protein [Rhodothermales bacterium]